MIKLTLFIMVLGLSAAAVEPPKGPMSKEQRQARAAHHEKVAALHTKMAACLRSDKSMESCHQTMKDECSKEQGLCPWMEHGRGGSGGGMHGGGMGGPGGGPSGMPGGN